MNLFKKTDDNISESKKVAKIVEPGIRVRPTGIDQVKLFDMIKEMSEIQAKEKAFKSILSLIGSEIKNSGKEEFSKLFEDNGTYPGSFYLEAIKDGDTAQVMFLPSDRYIKINSDQSESLIEEFGSDIVTEDTQYSFDKDMLEKYSDEISQAIMDSDIPYEDKIKIIVPTTSYSIAKGTISKLNQYGNVESLVERIKPVVMLKGAEVIKG